MVASTWIDRHRQPSRHRTSAALVVLAAMLGLACNTSTPYGAAGAPAGSGDTAKTGGRPKSEANATERSASADTAASGSTHITQLDPASIRAGSAPNGLAIKVTGAGFDSSTKLSVNGLVLATTVVSATSLSATVPADKLAAAGSLSLTAASAKGTSNAIALTVAAGGATITSLAPSSAAIGTSSVDLVLTGSGFDTGSVVVFNGTDLATRFDTATSLKANVPSSLLGHAGGVNVTVRGAGTLSTPSTFTITQAATVPSTACNGGATCADFGLGALECVDLGTSVVQCETDGCVYDGCF